MDKADTTGIQAASPFPGQYDRRIAAIGVFGHELVDFEIQVLKDAAVFIRGQAGLIHVFTGNVAAPLPFFRPHGEHHHSAWVEVAGKKRQHRPLLIAGQVEKAVPSQQAAKPPPQVELTHVRHLPALFRETLFDQPDHGLCVIHTGQVVSFLDEIPRYRLARSASDIKDRCICWQQGFKFCQPTALEQCFGAILVGLQGVALVNTMSTVGYTFQILHKHFSAFV